jgi:alkanesulfonate monooxygenase SsuD/methylene tetrahydromethanopterin reductase-like flavin-dependent oxidoreductase (luciferase family)
MPVFEDTSINGLDYISKIAHESMYYSVLLTYHSKQNDVWIKCARTLNTIHKFKYMIAIRAYAISPEYFAMMYKGFQEIDKNRLMFNVVAGDLHNNETSLEDLILIKEHLDTSQKRVDYLYQWIKKVKELIPSDFMPEIVMSGNSEKTLNYASEMADYNLCMIHDFIKTPDVFFKNKNRMVASAVVIRDSYEEAEKVINSSSIPHEKQWTIFGTEDQILEKIKEVKQIGATDFLIRRHSKDFQTAKVHDFVKRHGGIIV